MAEFDNISTDEIKRRLILFLRIPNETWTDVLKTISRQILVQNIAPACYRFKEICDKKVENVHVIKNAKQFNDILAEDDQRAKKQLEHLAGNKCQLSRQFRLIKCGIGENSQAILLNCPDLFSACKVKMCLGQNNKKSPLFLQCLGQLEKAKPIEINIDQIQNVDQLVDFWHNPTFQNCTRINLFFCSMSAATHQFSIFENIFEWLHHQPSEIDHNGSADWQVRCMIFWYSYIGYNHIEWLINRCTEEIQQARVPADRRSYVFNFQGWNWPIFDKFPVENKSTGEMLLLDRAIKGDDESFGQCRLRRCLTEEIANGLMFYAKLFTVDRGYAEFEIEGNTTKVLIESEHL